MMMDRKRNGVYQPGDILSNMGEEVLEVLKSKNLEMRPTTEAICSCYTGAPPVLFPLDITAYKLKDVVRQLFVGEGPGGRTWSVSSTGLYDIESLVKNSGRLLRQ